MVLQWRVIEDPMHPHAFFLAKFDGDVQEYVHPIGFTSEPEAYRAMLRLNKVTKGEVDVASEIPEVVTDEPG